MATPAPRPDAATLAFGAFGTSNALRALELNTCGSSVSVDADTTHKINVRSASANIRLVQRWKGT